MQMEIYEDYNLLQAKILEFSVILQESSKYTGEKSHEGIEAGYWLKRYKEHFNITSQRHGEIKDKE